MMVCPKNTDSLQSYQYSGMPESFLSQTPRMPERIDSFSEAVLVISLEIQRTVPLEPC